MRFATVFLLSVSAFLAGCANEGVIVGKNSGPQPFYHTLGVDGSYTFMLRDSGGAVHRQLVTPEVFERYAVGDYFNDLQTAPGQTPGGESKTMQPALQSPQPVVTVAKLKKRAVPPALKMAQKKKPVTASKRIAQRTKKSTPATRRKVTRRSIKPQPAKPSALPHHIAQVSITAAQGQQPDSLRVVSVPRCR